MIDCEPAVFDKLVDWLYGATIARTTTDQTSKVSSNVATSDIFWCKLYMFAEQYSAQDLATQALLNFESSFRTRHHHDPLVLISKETINFIYNAKQPGSALRSAAIEVVLFCYFQSQDDGENEVNALLVGVEEAYSDLLSAISKHIYEKKCSSYRFCFYHDEILAARAIV